MKPNISIERILAPVATVALMLGAAACGDNVPYSSQTLPPLSSQPESTNYGNTSTKDAAIVIETSSTVNLSKDSSASSKGTSASTNPVLNTEASTSTSASIVPELEINRTPIISNVPTPETVALANPTVPAAAEVVPVIKTLDEAIFCGIPLGMVLDNPQEVINMLKAVNITEVHPPCTSAYGRQGIDEGRTVVDRGITLTKANQVMLELGKENGFQYFVDEPRFLSGDIAQIQAAFDDYKLWAMNGSSNFGIELQDELQPDAIAKLRPALEKVRDFLNARGLDAASLFRFNLAYIPDNVPEIVRTMHDIFGPNVRLGIDAYTLDPKVWDNINAAMNQPGYEIKDWSIAIKGSQWHQLVGAEIKQIQTPEQIAEYFKTHQKDSPTASEIAKYYKIALKYQQSGVKGVYVFTGGPAIENKYFVIFDGDLSQPKNLAKLQKGRKIAGVNADNTFHLQP